MHFSGHETFHIRYGWLHKGLRLLIESPDQLFDKYSADWLGVGRNMAKSIRHWLVATGLAENVKERKNDKNCETNYPFIVSKFGKMVWKNDPYFLEKGTWLTLHSNLVINNEYATTWSWFFNNFNMNKFEKPTCMDNLQRFIQMGKGRMPAINTLNKDLGVLLASYSQKIPGENLNPEEGRDCPFVELGLMKFFKSSGYYELNREMKDIPPELLGYVLSKAFHEENWIKRKSVDIKMQDALFSPNSPGKVFVLSGDSLYELILRISLVA